MMNVALHGLEEAAGVRYQVSGRHAGDTRPGCPVVVRYADDLVACCHSRQQAEQVKAQLTEWLAPRGLAFNEDKTKIVHLSEGFDFLGFNVRRYRNGKLLIKPGSAAVKRLRSRLAAEMHALRGSNAAAVIAALTPVIRGWAAYYQGVVSSKIFGDLDDYMWKLTYRWAKRSHGGKPKQWVVHRYFGRFNKCVWPGGRPGAMKCSRWPAGRGRRLETGALRVRNKSGAGPAGPGIVAASTNPRFG